MAETRALSIVSPHPRFPLFELCSRPTHVTAGVLADGEPSPRLHPLRRDISASAADANTRFFRAPCDIRAAASNVNACTPSFSAHTRTVKLAWYAMGSPGYARKSAPNLIPVVSVKPRACRSANTA